MALYGLLKGGENGIFNNYGNGREMEHIKKADHNIMQRWQNRRGGLKRPHLADTRKYEKAG